MSGRLAGKVAFITGAARGQGRAHAVRMANEGADIIAVDIAGKLPPCVPYDPATPDDLAETVNLVEATGRRIVASVVDTRDVDGLRNAVDGGVAALGRLDIIVANAGVSAPQTWDAISPEDFRDVMDINVTGTWNTVMAGAQKIIDGGRGGIHHPDQLRRRDQDAAVHGALHREQARGHRDGPRIRRRIGPTLYPGQQRAPGAVNTLMGGGDMIGSLGRAIETYPQLAQMITPFLPTWAAAPEDIADAVCWLASEESKNVTAAVISIDQGMTQY